MTTLSQGYGNLSKVFETLHDGCEVVVEIHNTTPFHKKMLKLLKGLGYKNKTLPLYKRSIKHQAMLIKSTECFYLHVGSSIMGLKNCIAKIWISHF